MRAQEKQIRKKVICHARNVSEILGFWVCETLQRKCSKKKKRLKLEADFGNVMVLWKNMEQKRRMGKTQIKSILPSVFVFHVKLGIW